MRKSGPDVPPGYDPALDAKPKTKAAKRNERRKEKRHQVGLPLSLLLFHPCHRLNWLVIGLLLLSTQWSAALTFAPSLATTRCLYVNNGFTTMIIRFRASVRSVHRHQRLRSIPDEL